MAEARRRWPRRLAGSLLGAFVAYGGALALGMPAALPFDVVVNLGAFAHREDLAAPQDGKRRLVVLVHGLWRSPWSLWRLERALRDHGYEALAPGYPSTDGTLQQHAARVRQQLDDWQRQHGRADAIAFVGHSMGGLVVQELLRQPEATEPFACVYLATPHRGAVLSDLRQNWWLFRLVMGTGAAFQLSPGDPFHDQPIPCLPVSGALVGDRGPCNPSIPGNDDGTVGVTEAALAGACDQIVLDSGHTRITIADAAVAQVLAFLRHGRFRH